MGLHKKIFGISDSFRCSVGSLPYQRTLNANNPSLPPQFLLWPTVKPGKVFYWPLSNGAEPNCWPHLTIQTKRKQFVRDIRAVILLKICITLPILQNTQHIAHDAKHAIRFILCKICNVFCAHLIDHKGGAALAPPPPFSLYHVHKIHCIFCKVWNVLHVLHHVQYVAYFAKWAM